MFGEDCYSAYTVMNIAILTAMLQLGVWGGGDRTPDLTVKANRVTIFTKHKLYTHISNCSEQVAPQVASCNGCQFQANLVI